ncbi:MAG: imidazole glycerol phosphate synthase subunit HisH [Oscillospiraceae bacterium]|jgi:glutamine amidotransferase|nr:imidazole glycerol phosphate synthase subunit HisH [Oscillospiraceae bacterium]
MTVIVDYGVGNLFSLRSSLRFIGEEAAVSREPEELRAADRIILPGVGAFEDAARKLRELELDKIIIELSGEGRPLLGICLGMQLLFERSFEFGVWEGLGLLPGEVRPIEPVIPPDFKVPHIGWNALRFSEAGRESGLLKYTKEGEYVYFVHSYAAMGCEESLLADTEYGGFLTAAVGRENVFGTQFHPEKSGEAGLRILKGFCEL